MYKLTHQPIHLGDSFASRSLQVQGSTFSIADLSLSLSVSLSRYVTLSLFFSFFLPLYILSLSVCLALSVRIQIGFASTIWPPYNGSSLLSRLVRFYYSKSAPSGRTLRSIALILSFFLSLSSRDIISHTVLHSLRTQDFSATNFLSSSSYSCAVAIFSMSRTSCHEFVATESNSSASVSKRLALFAHAPVGPVRSDLISWEKRDYSL